MRVDEVQTPDSIKESCIVSADAPPMEVSVERICRKSSDGSSEHSYIIFQPVKEEVRKEYDLIIKHYLFHIHTILLIDKCIFPIFVCLLSYQE